MKWFAVAALSLTLAGCATPPEAERRVTYACDRGEALTVVYSGTTATIVGEGEPIVLPQQPSGSGFLYETPRHSIRGKGDEITYTVGRMVPMTCRAN